jgi:2-(1,2-epoxy-1,2-dihydrophenyl)acetyl-CoA isomerase
MTARILDTGTSELLCSIDQGVATLTLNRPEKRNALSDNLTPALRAMLLDLDVNPEVRCLVITGAGKSFCSGGDLSGLGDAESFSESRMSESDRVEQLKERQRTLTCRLYYFSKPTIAAISGPAAGAGLCIALACDLRLASTGSFLTTGYSKIGLCGDYGGTWLLPRLVGPAIAKELYFSSRRVTAEEALRIGLINELVPDEGFGVRIKEYALSIARGSPIAIKLIKENINKGFVDNLEDSLDREAANLMTCARTDDHREAVRAFIDKREPIFEGR